MKYTVITALLFLVNIGQLKAQTAKEIVQKADEKYRGQSSYSELVIEIIRPKWSREMTTKSWSQGTEYSLTLITGPAKEKGIAFLKRGNEVWNWNPTIERTIKLPPSMMSQSWMGTDLTNDDLVQQSSIVKDYTHTIVGDSTIENRTCWKIELIPNDDAAVVWGKINMWIDQKDFLQLKTEFYDEDGYLINVMKGSNITTLGGNVLAKTMEFVPVDEPGNLTRMTYVKLEFNQQFDANLFSIQTMKTLND